MTSMDEESSRANSFEALYVTHRGEAVRLAWLLTHDPALAEAALATPDAHAPERR